MKRRRPRGKAKPAPRAKVIQMGGWRVKEGGKIRPMTREEIGEQLLHGKIVKVERRR
jgi:hypothetical protein